MATLKQPLALVVGKKYKGSFWLNEFGEIHVNPEQKGIGSSNGQKLVEEGDNFSIYTTKKCVSVKFSFLKASPKELAASFTQAVTKVLSILLTKQFKIA